MKANTLRFWRRLLNLGIHVTHAGWIVALIVSVDKDGAIARYSIFMPPLIFASFLEMWRWVLLGKQIVEIKGPYSHALAVEAVNRDFLLFSWYVIPPFPPFKLLERYTTGHPEIPVWPQRSQLFSRFWLKSDVTFPLLILGAIIISALYSGSSPEIYGFGKFYPITCLFWIVGFGTSSKSISLFVYSIFNHIHKGI